MSISLLSSGSASASISPAPSSLVQTSSSPILQPHLLRLIEWGTGSTFVEVGQTAVVATIIAGGLLRFAPEYTDRVTSTALDEPVVASVFGFMLAVTGLLASVGLAGIVGALAVPLIVGYALIMGFAAVLGGFAVGYRLTRRWDVAGALAVFFSAVLSAVPYLGASVGIGVSCLGAGAMFLTYQESDDAR